MDILILLLLVWILGRKARAKGLRGWPYQLLLVGLWFVGEFAGAFVGFVVLAATGSGPALIAAANSGSVEGLFPLLLCALVGAACGAGVTFFIVGMLPDISRKRNDYGDGRDDEEEQEMPWDRALPENSDGRFSDRRSAPPPRGAENGVKRRQEPDHEAD
jgi:hypothetical protein